MSTSFELYEQQRDKHSRKTTLSIGERSTLFDITMVSQEAEGIDPEGYETVECELERLTAEEVVDIAMKMIQPTLYNVADPKAFMRDVIRKKLDALFV